jgi:flagellar M-ring protein FliF
LDKITELYNRLATFISDFWLKLSTPRRVALISGIALIFVFFGGLLLTHKTTEQQYLFTDLSPEDVSSITNFFKKSNYGDYLIDQSGIKVPKDDVDRLRVQLSQEGLPNKGIIGWEQFDNNSFTKTEFEQEIHKQRAIQGELARTISAIDGIKSARVHIVTPKKSLFVRDEKKPTAAIYLNTKQGFKLDKKQIGGIQHLVSRSVEGLEPNQITIIDSEGHMLTEIESTDEATKQTHELLTFKHSIEQSLEDRIRAIVGKVVGLERVEAKVDAEVDLTQERQTISDVDPDNTVVVSKNTTGFSMQGEGLGPTGIPGSKSNVPGEQENVASNTSKSGSKKESELVNFEFSKKVSEKILAVGNITRLTVSAIVDGKQIYPIDGSTAKFEARPAEEMKKIESLIKDAVGFKEGRDSLTVQNMMFELDQTQMLAIKTQKKEDRDYLSTLVFSGIIALALVLFFAFIVRPYFRWLSYDPEKKEEQSIIEEYKPELEIGSMQSVKVQEEVPFEKLTPKEQVLFLAKHEPKRTTEAIRMLMNPNNIVQPTS